jgi:hypothetical protein
LEVTDSASEEVVLASVVQVRLACEHGRVRRPGDICTTMHLLSVVQKARHLLPRCAEGWHQGMHMHCARVKLNPFFTCLESERMAASLVYFQYPQRLQSPTPEAR